MAKEPKRRKDGTLKKRMSNKKYRVLHGIGIVLLALLVGVANIAGDLASGLLNSYVSTGKSSVQNPAETVDWDTDYYDVRYASADEAKEAAYAVARKIQNEGTVLLANDGVLPLDEGSTVRPFGYAYENPIYGQLTTGGSAKMAKDPVTPEQGLSAFAIDTAAVDAMHAAGEPMVTVEAEGTSAAGEAGSMLGGDCKLYEYDAAIYDDLAAADAGTTGIVFITRAGQEGQDQKFDAYEDGTPHYLALSANEKGAIAASKATCDHTVVVLVGSAVMEFGELVEGDLAVDAILYYGHCGDRGMEALSEILTGAVNPSGHTVDIWPADLTAGPTYTASGEHTYTNLSTESGSFTDGGTFNRTFNEYREGVYMGYRWYETADEVDASFDYDAEVVFPFGHGLSYTTFEKTLDSVEMSDGMVTATVTVTNTGSVAGKDVVQLYASSPYTELDQQLGIEKPSCYLVAFDKTAELAPGASETVTLSFSTDDLTSYSYAHVNGDGTVGCYVLEAGDYAISLRENSHDVIDSKDVTIADTTWYDGSDNAHVRDAEKQMQSALDDEGNALIDDSVEYQAATNHFQNMSDYMVEESELLTRSDWNATQPDVPETREISDEFTDRHDLYVTFDPETDPEYGNVEGSKVYAAEAPISDASNGLVASDLRGLDYDDPRWDELLDQIDWDADADSIKLNFSGDAYMTQAIDSIGLPGTVDEDGANGLKVPGGTDQGYDLTKSSSTGFAPLMASTWNTELVYEMAAAFGQESLQHQINGWYAPAINLHRSAFSGRVFEYYSEDPLISGKMAAAAISGAGDQGMYCYLKHFALNETDTGRSRLICTWADEQTMRELYLRAFEIAFREGRMTVRYSDGNGGLTSTVRRAGNAVMASQTCLGTQLGHTNYALLTELLRGEWGFEGMVISDYWVWSGDNHRDLALRAGCDTYLCMPMSLMWSISDYDSATSRVAMREAIHNTAYTVVNSSAMQGVAPGGTVRVSPASWQYAIWAFTGVGLALIAWRIWRMVQRGKDELEHPDWYKRSAKAEARLQKRLAQSA